MRWNYLGKKFLLCLLVMFISSFFPFLFLSTVMSVSSVLLSAITVSAVSIERDEAAEKKYTVFTSHYWKCLRYACYVGVVINVLIFYFVECHGVDPNAFISIGIVSISDMLG